MNQHEAIDTVMTTWQFEVLANHQPDDAGLHWYVGPRADVVEALGFEPGPPEGLEAELRRLASTRGAQPRIARKAQIQKAMKMARRPIVNGAPDDELCDEFSHDFLGTHTSAPADDTRCQCGVMSWRESNELAMSSLPPSLTSKMVH